MAYRFPPCSKIKSDIMDAFSIAKVNSQFKEQILSYAVVISPKDNRSVHMKIRRILKKIIHGGFGESILE